MLQAGEKRGHLTSIPFQGKIAASVAIVIAASGRWDSQRDRRSCARFPRRNSDTFRVGISSSRLDHRSAAAAAFSRQGRRSPSPGKRTACGGVQHRLCHTVACSIALDPAVRENKGQYPRQQQPLTSCNHTRAAQISPHDSLLPH